MDRKPIAMRARLGMTLIELLVVVAIIALMIAILLPTLGRIRESARRQICLSNTRTQAAAFLVYAQDFGGMLPRSARVPYGQGSWEELCIIPGATARALHDYGLNDGPDPSAFPDLAANHATRTVWKCASAAYNGNVPRFHRPGPTPGRTLFYIDHFYVLSGLEGNAWYWGAGSPATIEDDCGALTADVLVAPLGDPTHWVGYHGQGKPVNDWVTSDGINQSYSDGRAEWVTPGSLGDPITRRVFTSPTRHIAWREPGFAGRRTNARGGSAGL